MSFLCVLFFDYLAAAFAEQLGDQAAMAQVLVFAEAGQCDGLAFPVEPNELVQERLGCGILSDLAQEAGRVDRLERLVVPLSCGGQFPVGPEQVPIWRQSGHVKKALDGAFESPHDGLFLVSIDVLGAVNGDSSDHGSISFRVHVCVNYSDIALVFSLWRNHMWGKLP